MATKKKIKTNEGKKPSGVAVRSSDGRIFYLSEEDAKRTEITVET